MLFSLFLVSMSTPCLTDRRLARSRVLRQNINRWTSFHLAPSPTNHPMASHTSEKGRVSTNNHTEYGPDAEQGGVLSTSEGRAHVSGISNPGPMGLFAFASTTFILSMYNVQTRGIAHPNVVVGMAIFAGGLTQFIAGMWEFPRGNVFGATAFSSYGAFWMSYATIFIPSSGILAAYPDPNELASALGIYLTAWLMVTLFFLLAVVLKNIAYTALLSSLTVAFACLAAAQFSGEHHAGGVFGIITALIAYYIGVSEMLAAEQRAVFVLPLGVWR
ncbi:Fun34 transmembrane protein [Mycena venus]|uniref:Fun34 transmembrane protein n=1 Tax=Mycena venus TaxID=2733690 RepID=A0A8H6Y517_9AGAR|nr:Fun34 transmembrane protein [Mycena venus]